LESAPAVYTADTSAEQTATVILVEDLTETHMLEAELAHSERLAMIGRLAAGVAHEIGNPVTGIACLAQIIRDEEPNPDTLKSVEEILEQTKRVSVIMRSLVEFSHSGHDDSDRAEIELVRCIDDAVRLVTLSGRGKEVNCENHCPDNLTVYGDRQRLVQVFVNVLSNAIDASPPQSVVQIHAVNNDDMVTIQIRDRGHGIPADKLEEIFEPFFTTKQPGEGTGLGLSLVYNIVKEHGGDINVVSEVDHGTVVSIRLPVREQAGQLRAAAGA